MLYTRARVCVCIRLRALIYFDKVDLTINSHTVERHKRNVKTYLLFGSCCTNRPLCLILRFFFFQVKDACGHEKFPSWPATTGTKSNGMSATARKSWAEQTSYPKEQPPPIVRPYPKRLSNGLYTQQVKTNEQNLHIIYFRGNHRLR